MKIINRVIFAAVFTFCAYVMVQHTAKSSIFYGDSLGYYAYLPAFFIHDNVAEIQKVAEVSSIDKYARQNIVNWEKSYALNDNGNVIIQYTYGVAAMHAPFFLVAHLIDIVIGGAADGYNKTYIWGIRVAGFIYCYLGFLLLYRLFRRLGYEKSLIYFVLGVVFWGTNLWWFTIYQSGMAHVIIFFLVAALMYMSERYWSTYEKRWLLLLGFTLGMITIIRPTDIVFGLIPLLYGAVDRLTWGDRWASIVKHWKNIVLWGGAGFIIPIIPQLMYWHYMTGHWVFQSYKDQGFDFWLKPKFYLGLLGANNGWLTYNPVMLIPLLAVFYPRAKNVLKWSAMVLVPLYMYVAYSWWCYYYINGFGSRPMIHLYPVLALAFIALLTIMNSKPRSIVIGIAILLGAVNLNYSHKELNDWLYSDESNHKFNFSTFFQNGLDYSDLILRDTGVPQPRVKEAQQIEAISITSDSVISIIDEYSPYKLSHTIGAEDKMKEFIMVGGDFMLPYVSYSTYEHVLLVFIVKRGGEQIIWKGIKLNNKIGKYEGSQSTIHKYYDQIWGEVYFKYPMFSLQEGDEIESFFWNPKKQELRIRKFDMYTAMKE